MQDLHKIRLNVFRIDAATAVARAKDLFAAEGLVVEATVTPNSTDQMRGLSQGKYDIVEVVRAVVVKQGRDIPLSGLLATVLVERVLDLLTMVLFLGATLFFFGDEMADTQVANKNVIVVSSDSSLGFSPMESSFSAAPGFPSKRCKYC